MSFPLRSPPKTNDINAKIGGVEFQHYFFLSFITLYTTEHALQIIRNAGIDGFIPKYFGRFFIIIKLKLSLVVYRIAGNMGGGGLKHPPAQNRVNEM